MACKMSKDRIKLMHKLFGIDEKHICKTCKNLITAKMNRSYNKCICYGKSCSEATDWRQKWIACGLYNKDYDGVPVIEIKKHMPRPKKDTQIEGQTSLFDEGSI